MIASDVEAPNFNCRVSISISQSNLTGSMGSW